MTNSKITVVADFPAKQVVKIDDHDIGLPNQKGDENVVCRTASAPITIRAFKGDKYEYVRDFKIGFDGKDGYWAFGSGAMLTDTPSKGKDMSLGFELGDTITIEGHKFRIEEAPNHNIKFVGI
jgi:hypothetical protein